MLRRTVRRSWIVLIFVLPVVVALLVMASGADAVSCASGTDQWTGGTTGNWSTSASWSLGVPTSSEIACWASNVTITVDSGSQAAAAVTGGGSLVINGGALRSATPLTPRRSPTSRSAGAA